MGPGFHLEGSWRLLGALEEAWSAKGTLGRLLDAFGTQKTLLGSALGRPKGTKESGFTLPEGQMSGPKGPRRVRKLAPKANRAENRKTSKITDSTADVLDC